MSALRDVLARAMPAEERQALERASAGTVFAKDERLVNAQALEQARELLTAAYAVLNGPGVLHDKREEGCPACLLRLRLKEVLGETGGAR